MVKTGLDLISEKFPRELSGKKVGVLCHAPSITRNYVHITDFLAGGGQCQLAAVFGPQHGVYGQTQDNMIEWEGYEHQEHKIPVYSLYGRERKPSPLMLKDLEALIIDLQDVGARLYTYIWTVKLCMEACAGLGIPVWVLDRPNPVGKLPLDGPVLKEEYFTFVGGACIPLCHRMTVGEMALWIKNKYIQNCDLKVVWMKNWHRNTMYHETGLPWVLPSPNMPTVHTATVYPGMVLIEALNLSEGRGTTIPFELFGAPFIDSYKLLRELEKRNIRGCKFRQHDFIPTFHKFAGSTCFGIQVHVTDIEQYHPVGAALDIFDAIIGLFPGTLKFNMPPYEYEDKLMPFDILSGDPGMRECLTGRNSISAEKERWRSEAEEFSKEFSIIAAYPG